VIEHPAVTVDWL